MNSLILPEHLLLLALRDDNGAVVHSSALALPYGLNGALILELSLRQRVKIEKDVLVEVSREPTGDDILDEALKSLEDCERDKSAEFWIARPDALVENLKHRLLDRLVTRGILQRAEHRFLWLLPYDRYPEQDGEPERNIRERVHDAVLNGAQPSKRTAMLITLIHACELAEEVFPEAVLPVVKPKLKMLSEGDQVAKAVSDDVDAATTTAVATTIMAAIIPTIDTP